MAIVPELVRQAAAIPVLGSQVCLVSSRSGKRWVIPKGCLEPGKTAGEIALQEAWEEAGLVGILQPDPLGSYLYEKDSRKYHVLVFLMQVTQVAKTWPECNWRDRNWLNVNQAASQIDEIGLQEMIRGISAGKVVVG
jgi:8-oxo-dGTP pyrophosphatase MutT (NUDIX family)